MKQVIVRFRSKPEWEKYILSKENDLTIAEGVLVMILKDGNIIGINMDLISDFSIEDSNE